MTRNLPLLVSATLNAALLAFVVYAWPQPHSRAASNDAVSDISAPLPPKPSPPVRPQPAESVERTVSAAPLPWTFENAGEILERLRAVGIAAPIRYRVATRLVLERLEVERRQITHVEPRYVWQHGAPPTSPASPAKRLASFEINLKREEMLLALMGDDYLQGRFTDDQLDDPKYGGLARDKVRQAIMIEIEHNEARSLSVAAGARPSLPETESAKEADLRAVLTKDEYERYRLYNSDRAFVLQSNLIGTEVNDEQYAAIYYALSAADTGDPRSGPKNVTMAVDIVTRHAGADAALVYAKALDRGNSQVIGLFQAAGLESTEILRRHARIASLSATAAPRASTGEIYLDVTAGLSSEQLASFDATQAGRRLKPPTRPRPPTP